MRCMACNTEHEGKDDLCSKCQPTSDSAVIWAQMEPIRYSTSEGAYFDDFVVRHKRMDSWSDGLGLMDPDARAEYLLGRAWERYQDNRSCGMARHMAAARACWMDQGEKI